MSIINFKLFFGFIIIFVFSGLVSCGKKTEQVEQKTDQSDTEFMQVEDDDVNEKSEDLVTVDYKEFYKELEPHGEWIEVTDKEIGVNLSDGSIETPVKHKTITLSGLLGISDVYAAEVSLGAFFIWRPSPDLAVTVSAGETPPVYVPYSNGNWMYTDAGWYFAAPTPQEEIVHHYGRWMYSPSLGWVWLPGRVWSPAWVDWRENDTYVAWTPIPPGIYITNNVIVSFPLVEENYIVVERKYFAGPDFYKYMYKENKNKIMIKEWKRTDGIMVMNKTVINKGPDITVIKQKTGKEINTVKIKKVKSFSEHKVTKEQISAYEPSFKKVKTKGDVSVPPSKPDKYVSFKDVKSEKTDDGTTGKKEDEKQSEEKGKVDKKTDEKSKEKGYEKDKTKKKSDDGTMKDGGKNKEDKGRQQEDKGRQKEDKGKQKDDKGGKEKGKEKGKK